RARPGDIDGDALLQEKRCSLNHSVCVKTLLHNVVVQNIINGYKAHSLMMRHEGLNDYALLILRHALRRVINRLVETVARKSAFACQAIKVIFRSQGCDHACEHCGVRRDDKLLTQTALQSEA